MYNLRMKNNKTGCYNRKQLVSMFNLECSYFVKIVKQSKYTIERVFLNLKIINILKQYLYVKNTLLKPFNIFIYSWSNFISLLLFVIVKYLFFAQVYNYMFFFAIICILYTNKKEYFWFTTKIKYLFKCNYIFYYLNNLKFKLLCFFFPLKNVDLRKKKSRNFTFKMLD